LSASKKLENLFSGFPDVLLLQNKEGIFTESLTSDNDVLPIPPVKFIGKTFFKLFPESFASLAEKQRLLAIETQTVKTIEFSAKKENKKHFYEVRLIPKEDILLVAIRDITFIKQSEHTLKSLEKKYNALLTEYEQLKQQDASNKQLLDKEKENLRQRVEQTEDIDHNLRTFMNGVLGFADILREESKELSNQSYYLFADTIFKNGQKLLSLIDLNLASDSGSGKLELDIKPCSTSELIPNIIEKFKEEASKKNIKLNFSDRAKYRVMADETRLTEVISNLVDNAIKHSNASAVLIESGYDINREMAVIRIKDTGDGIDESLLPHLFNPFKQNDKQSSPFLISGLGLSIAKRLVELMYGQIELTSTQGKGLTVTVYLPASDKTEEGITVRDTIFFASSNEIVFLSKLQPYLLIVEDDTTSRRMLEITLGKVAKLNLAKDGEEALQLIQSKYEVGQRYDLILLDIGLPPPWDGLKLREEIISRFEDYSKIPFIAQTAFALKEDKNRILKAGFNGYIAKPIDRRDLIKNIAQLLKDSNI